MCLLNLRYRRQHDVCGVRSASIGGRRSAFLAGRDNDENIQWVFIFISRVLSNPAAAFGESPGFDGSACVVASCQLPFAVASWFLVSGAVPVTSLATADAAPEGLLELDTPGRLVVTRCFFSPLHVRACPPAPPD